jgi:endogenous inhibitor of DNA gyrase (YacG/DUF329 family)
MLDLGDWASERYRVPVEEEKKPPEGDGEPEEKA